MSTTPTVELSNIYDFGQKTSTDESGERMLAAARDVSSRWEETPWLDDRVQTAALNMLEAVQTFNPEPGKDGRFYHLNHALSQAAGRTRRKAQDAADVATWEIDLVDLTGDDEVQFPDWLVRYEPISKDIRLDERGFFIQIDEDEYDQVLVTDEGEYLSVRQAALRIEEEYDVDADRVQEMLLDHVREIDHPILFEKEEEEDEKVLVETTRYPLIETDEGFVLENGMTEVVETTPPRGYVAGDEDEVRYDPVYEAQYQRDLDDGDPAQDRVEGESFVRTWLKPFLDAWKDFDEDGLVEDRNGLFLKYEREGRREEYPDQGHAFHMWQGWFKDRWLGKLIQHLTIVLRTFSTMRGSWNRTSQLAMAALLGHAWPYIVEFRKAKRVYQASYKVEEAVEYLAEELDDLQALVRMYGEDLISDMLSDLYDEKAYRWLTEVLDLPMHVAARSCPVSFPHQMLKLQHTDALHKVPAVKGLSKAETFRVWYQRIRGKGWVEFSTGYVTWLYYSYEPSAADRKLAAVLDEIGDDLDTYRGSEGLDYGAQRSLLGALSDAVVNEGYDSPFWFLYNNLGLQSAASGDEQYHYPTTEDLRDSIREDVLNERMWPEQAIKLMALLDGLSPYHANGVMQDAFDYTRKALRILGQRRFATENQARIVSTFYPGLFAPRENRVLIYGEANPAQVNKLLRKLGAYPNEVEIVGLKGTTAEQMTEYGWTFIDFDVNVSSRHAKRWSYDQAMVYATRAWIIDDGSSMVDHLKALAKDLGVHAKVFGRS